MLAKIIKTEGPCLCAQIEIENQVFHVMDSFSSDNYKANGDIMDLKIEAGLFGDDESWEEIFSGNPESKMSLDYISGWSYKAYGIITRVNPVYVNVGIFEIEAPIASNDIRLVGESIAFMITRLDANSY